MQESPYAGEFDGDPAEEAPRKDKRNVVAYIVLALGLLGLAGVTWTELSRSNVLNSDPTVKGKITSRYTTKTTEETIHGTFVITYYYISFGYLVDNKGYDVTWEVSDQSILDRLPVGTEIAVAYSPGRPGEGRPIGAPFDSNDNNPLLVMLGLLVAIVINGFLPLVMIAIGIVLLRGFLRGRLILDSKRRVAR